MKDIGVMERMALANGSEDARNPREFLATHGPMEQEKKSGFISLPPSHFIRVGEGEPPPERKRYLAGNVEERWDPQYEPGENWLKGPQLVGWWVRFRYRTPWCDCTHAKFEPMFVGANLEHDLVHKACGRHARNKRGNTPIGEHIQSLQFQAMSDFDYEGFYPTMKGDDIIRLPDKPERFMRALRPNEGKVAVSADHYDVNGRLIQKGQVMRGGKEITGGRREYREHLKATRFEPVDSGYQAHVDRNAKARKAKQKRDIEHAAEKIAHKYFPMSGRLGES